MARVYVKGYTKSDGTKVEGHYREMGGNGKGRIAQANRVITRIGGAKLKSFYKGRASRIGRFTRRQSSFARIAMRNS